MPLDYIFEAITVQIIHDNRHRLYADILRECVCADRCKLALPACWGACMWAGSSLEATSMLCGTMPKIKHFLLDKWGFTDSELKLTHMQVASRILAVWVCIQLPSCIDVFTIPYCCGRTSVEVSILYFLCSFLSTFIGLRPSNSAHIYSKDKD